MALSKSKFDVVIIGGGPAGLSAALWCAELGLKAILIEKEAEPGGQLLRTFGAIKNYLGVDAADGRELCTRFLQSLNNRDVEMCLSASVVAVDLEKRSVTMADGAIVTGRAVIIATGVRRRKLGISGESEFRGRGVLESGVKERENIAGKTVVIVGGGDAALENALILGKTAKQIYIVHHRDRFRARIEFIEEAQKCPQIKLLTNQRTIAIVGNKVVEAVKLEHNTFGHQSTIEADAVLIRIGVSPNSDTFKGQLELDQAGYVVTDTNCAASVKMVFGVGDVANESSQTISSAVGDGTKAAKVIHRILRPWSAEGKIKSTLKNLDLS